MTALTCSNFIQNLSSLSQAYCPRVTALANTPPEARTFGKKINSAFKGPQSSRPHADLVPLRNLLAHANADVVKIDGDWSIVLRVADLAFAVNARIIPERRYKAFIATWKRMLKNALADADALSAQPAPHGSSTIKT